MRGIAWLIAASAVLLGAPAGGAEQLTKAELVALAKVERAMLELTAFALAGKDVAAANSALLAGLDSWPDAPKLLAELKRLRGKWPVAAAAPEFAPKLAKKRDALRDAAASALAEAVSVAVREGRPDRAERYLGLIHRHFPAEGVVGKLPATYFRPYFEFHSTDAIQRLDAGGELLDAKWLAPAEVEELDRSHARWIAPWVLEGDAYQLRTTLPLRTARQILGHAGRVRHLVLERFAALLDLQLPTGPLPLIATRTQSEIAEQVREATTFGKPPSVFGPGFYALTSGTLDPCFITLEPQCADGRVTQLRGIEQMMVPLTRTLVRQVCFEHSKQDAQPNVMTPSGDWAMVGFCTYIAHHVFDGRRWALTKPRQILLHDDVSEETPFAWCKSRARNLPPLARFIESAESTPYSTESACIAPVLIWFLLDGADGKYRAACGRFLGAAFKVRADAGTFARTFAGVDMMAMQAEWDRFVSGIALDPDSPPGK